MSETQREWNRETKRMALEGVRKDTTDPTLTVGDTVFCGGVYATVTEIKNYAPGEHGHSPIKNEMNAVEVVTDNGSRWHGRESRHVQERTQRPITLWHVMVDGEWLAVEYDGYAPVSAEVDGRLRPAEFRHMALDCQRPSCRDLLTWG